MRDGFGRLVLGDVIVGMNGRPVKKEADLFGGLAGPSVAVCLMEPFACSCLVGDPRWHCHPSIRLPLHFILFPLSACSLPLPSPPSSSQSSGAPFPSFSHPPCYLPPCPSPTDILDGCKVGDTVNVEVLRRGGQRKVLSVQLAERQPETTE